MKNIDKLPILSAFSSIAEAIGVEKPAALVDANGPIELTKLVEVGSYYAQITIRLRRLDGDGGYEMAYTLSTDAHRNLKPSQARCVALALSQASDLLAIAEAIGGEWRWSEASVMAERANSVRG